MRLRLRSIIALLLMLTLLPVSAPVTPALAQGGGSALIRVVNASPDAGNLNIFLNGALAARNVSTGEAFGYFEVPSGRQEISFHRGGQVVNNAVVQLDLQDGDFVTVVAYNNLMALQTAVLKDDSSPVVRGLVRVRMFNAVVGGPNVDLRGKDEIVTAEDIAFGSASDYVLLPSEPMTFTAFAAGTTSDPLLTIRNVGLRREKRYDIFLIGEVGKEVNELVVQSDTLLANGTNQIRFGNFSYEHPNVDVVFNQEDAFIGVRLAQVTNYALVVAPGEYDVEIYPQGQRRTPLTTTKLTIAPNQSFLLALTKDEAGLTLKAIEEPYEPLRVGQGRLLVVNIAEGAPLITYALADGTNLATLSQGARESFDLGAAYVSLKATADTGQLMSAIDVRLREGRTTGVVFYKTKDDWTLATYSYRVTRVVPIRFVHASTAGEVDMYLDGAKVIEGWAKGGSTDYVNLLPGRHQIMIFNKGANPETDTPLINRDLNLGAYALTAIIADLPAGTSLIMFPDNLLGPRPGYARARLIQASPQVGRVKWNNQVDGTPIVNDPISFGDASSAIDLVAGGYGFTVTSITDPNILLRVQNEFEPGSLITYVVTGPRSDDVVTLIFKVSVGK
ncbi:hypothetical protein ANRL4_03667 [Anaerolineae bacterium]|nr:hypothetical protein ANRL4_03667 [Anaerolineae bacterium]